MTEVTDIIRNPKLLESVLRPHGNSALQDVVLKTLAAEAEESSDWKGIVEIPGILRMLKELLPSNSHPNVVKRVLHILLNVSADGAAVGKLLSIPDCDDLVIKISKMVANANCEFADLAVGFLTNASRKEETCQGLIGVMGDVVTLPQLLHAFVTVGFNKKGQSLDKLAHVFGNISQVKDVRKFLLDKNHRWLCKLLPFLNYMESLDRRLGCAATIKNCSFETDVHDWILSPAEEDGADLLPFLLLPLAGPETLSDEENDSLPLDLQYLPDGKTREPCPEVRKLILETLLLLCATKKGREILRNRGTYYIMREYHNWETVPWVKPTLESVIHVLIRTEDEIGVDKYHDVDIPADILEALNKERVEEENELKQLKSTLT